MFAPKGLFKQIACPLYPQCTHDPCFYSHDDNLIRKRNADIESRTKKVTVSATQSRTTQPAKVPTGLKRPQASTTAQDRPVLKRRIEQPQPATLPPSQTPAPSAVKRATVPRTQPIPKQSLPKEQPRAKQMPSSQPTQTPSSSSSSQVPRRLAHTAAFSIASTGPPAIKPDLRAHTPIKTRQLIAGKVYEQFMRIYAPILAQSPGRATADAQRQEKHILDKTTNPTGYKTMATSVLMALKRRPVSINERDVGIEGEWIDPALKGPEKSLAEAALDAVLSKDKLKEMGYAVMPLDDPPENASMTVGAVRMCDRCKKQYTVKDILDNDKDPIACTYHPGRLGARTMQFGDKERQYSCCNEGIGSAGCCKGAHVYKDKDPPSMNAKIPYVPTPSGPKEKPDTWRAIVALDCEMAYTTAGMELVRITAVDEHNKTLLDELVFPSHMIIDLNSRFSGIKTLEGAKMDLAAVRKELFKYVDSDTILLGHGLENDMNALRLLHERIIDTAALFPHPKGLPFRYGLRVLANKHLKRFIQERADGHDSFEDAKTCVDLLQVYLKP